MAAKIEAKRLQDFKTESNLVKSFVEILQTGRTQYKSVQVVTEWNHKSGMVDILARDTSNSLIAFEAKLSNWKRAFLQAYRSTAYANRTYVLLPMQTAHRALRAQEEFEFRGIGLCAFDGETIHTLIEASEQDPILAWIRTRAHDYFDGFLDEYNNRLICRCN
jgi:hypothetical protein